MISALFFLLFIIVIGMACSAIPKLPISLAAYNITPIQTNVYIENRFSLTQETEIMNAFKSIECSTNYMVRYKIVFDATHNDYYIADPSVSLFVWKVDDENEHIKTEDERLHKLEGGKDRSIVGLSIPGDGDHSPTILLVMGRIGTNLQTITIHETLHSLGLPHSESKNSIMYPFLDLGSQTITSTDIEQLCKIYHFDPKGMHGCGIK